MSNKYPDIDQMIEDCKKKQRPDERLNITLFYFV